MQYLRAGSTTTRTPIQNLEPGDVLLVDTISNSLQSIDRSDRIVSFASVICPSRAWYSSRMSRINKTQSTLVSTYAQWVTLNVQRTAEQREWETFQTMMTSRLSDKDELISPLQRQIAEPPNDPDAPVENDTVGV